MSSTTLPQIQHEQRDTESSGDEHKHADEQVEYPENGSDQENGSGDQKDGSDPNEAVTGPGSQHRDDVQTQDGQQQAQYESSQPANVTSIPPQPPALLPNSSPEPILLLRL